MPEGRRRKEIIHYDERWRKEGGGRDNSLRWEMPEGRSSNEIVH
jgi:hypothetical protein